MKDDAVERVLRGLGTVEAPGGLEGRVLRRLEERGSRGRWEFGLAFAGMSLVGVLGLTFGVFGRGGGGHTPGAKARIVGGDERPKAEALGYLQAKTTAEVTATATADSSASLRNDKQASLGKTKRSVAAPAHVSEARDGVPGLVGGLESFPAPPEPLTEQERLLRRIALAGSEPAFELLNEETREAALAASDAEFEAFARSAPSGGRPVSNLDLQR